MSVVIFYFLCPEGKSNLIAYAKECLPLSGREAYYRPSLGWMGGILEAFPRVDGMHITGLPSSGRHIRGLPSSEWDAYYKPSLQ